ncbi:MAG: hypothetical protein J6C18_10785 [Bacteroidaceae bacterium]|nr:hypothetical protein [Bacteroidaceae bacterium]
MKYPWIRKLFGKRNRKNGRGDEKKWNLLAIKRTELTGMKHIEKIGESDEKCQKIGHFSLEKAFSSFFLCIIVGIVGNFTQTKTHNVNERVF